MKKTSSPKPKAKKSRKGKIHIVKPDSVEYFKALGMTGANALRAAATAATKREMEETKKRALHRAADMMVMSQANQEKGAAFVDISPDMCKLMAAANTPDEQAKSLIAQVAGIPFRVVDDLPADVLARVFNTRKELVGEVKR